MSNFSFGPTHAIVGRFGQVMFTLMLAGSEEKMMERAQRELNDWCMDRHADNDSYQVVRL